jgi:hypothetical protein
MHTQMRMHTRVHKHVQACAAKPYRINACERDQLHSARSNNISHLSPSPLSLQMLNLDLLPLKKMQEAMPKVVSSRLAD